MSKVQGTYPDSNKSRMIQIQASSMPGPVIYSDKLETPGVEATLIVLSHGEKISVFSMFVLGSAMQAFANEAIEAVLVALFLLLAGRALVTLVFPNRKPEMRAFLLMYAVCIFVGGLAQIYSLAGFNILQTTTDARGFLRQISPQPPFISFETVSYLGTSLAVVIWQQFYRLAWLLGFKFGPYTGVMANSMVMGLIASITVQIARELFGDDDWRLHRVGTLVAANGLFILFGAVLLRDCFTTFFMTLVLWGAIRFLVRANLQSLLIGTAVTGASAWAMPYLREDAFLLIFLYGILAVLFWLIARSRFIGLTITTFILLVTFVGSSFLSIYLRDIRVIQTINLQNYTDFAVSSEAANSLGVQLVYTQPLPIRIVAGSAVLMISPIPLWAHFRISSADYHWIKGYNGIYNLFVLPLVLAGSLAAFRMIFRNTKRSWSFLFLVIFVLINLVGVTATSLEQRHLGQFMSAFVIIAAIPDTRERDMENELRKIKAWWFFGVLLVHILWATMKIVQ